MDGATTGKLPEGGRIGIVGRGRVGGAFAKQLRLAGQTVVGPLGRSFDYDEFDLALLCVPDAAIADVAAAIPAEKMLGHCSGATPLSALTPHPAFSIHPLTTVASEDTAFAGVPGAVSASGPEAYAAAVSIAEALGLRAIAVEEDRRAIYHAAASAASNYLVATGWLAERFASHAGLEREDLRAIASQALENWLSLGAEQALTGPIARGDFVTLERQRQAVGRFEPDLLEAFDEFADATSQLADTRNQNLSQVNGARGS
ncbi:MAG: DUF2520 domain-containing protein [Solirubrobacterales bacterium]